MKKILFLLLFLASNVSAGGTVVKLGEGIFGGTNYYGRNLLKGVTATFELFDNTPTTIEITDEDFDSYSVLIGTTVNYSRWEIGSVIFDLNSIFNNIIVCCKWDMTVGEPLTDSKSIIFKSSDDGITYSNVISYSYVNALSSDGTFSLPMNARYIKIYFGLIGSQIDGENTIKLYEITATQYK